MKTVNHIGYFGVVIIITGIGCKKPYAPTIIATNSNYLVAEGVINAGQDSTTIKLSRTVNISDTVATRYELNARITVESDQNSIYPLQESGNGKYASAALNLDGSRKYRLHIITAEGKEYLSDFETVKLSPPIDSVGYTIQNNGIGLYVNTHDPSNNTRYYRWDYTETWNFHAKYEAEYKTDGTKLNFLTAAQQIYTCFASDTSSGILLGSTTALSQDVIYQNPLTQITSTSEKLETRYSLLVREYALTNKAYNFWQNLKKNTEQLGSIFDALPSDLQGNIHCLTNPLEPVLGYISVGTVQQKRIFISASQLPQTWKTTYPYQCELDTLLYCHPPKCQNDVKLFLLPLGTPELAVQTLYDINHIVIIGYIGTDRQCADCTIRGTTTQPTFWR